MRTARVLISAVIATFATSATAQTVPSRTFSKPELEYAEPFSQIVGLRELSDGRIIVADSKDKTLQLVDLVSKRATGIGREGAGPLEWGSPNRLLVLPGDSTLMVDPRNNRLFLIGPDGKPVRTVTPAAPTASGGITISGGGAVGSRFVDSKGRLYYQAANFSFASGTLPDSAGIVRYDFFTGATDTVGRIKLPPRGPARTTSSGGTSVSASSPVPFAAVDQWVALSDGRVVIAHSGEYRLEIIGPGGARKSGERVEYTPVPVTEAEKRAYMDNLRRTAAGRQININGVAQSAPPPAEPSEWPATMPAFPQNSVFPAPNGETWILRTRASSDPIPSFDVFDVNARRVARVVLPRNTSLIGFGARTVYLARTDDDGLQYIQRYSLN